MSPFAHPERACRARTVLLAFTMLLAMASGCDGSGAEPAGSESGPAETPSVKQAVLVDPVWTGVAAMDNAREAHTATLLPDGQVLVAGGGSIGGKLSSAEL